MAKYVKPARRQRPIGNELHLGSLKSLRNDIEALLRTYEEVRITWPTGSDAIDATLLDGRHIIVLVNITD